MAVPAILAGLVLLIPRRWASAVALGLAVLAGSLVVLGLPRLPPREPQEWLAALGLLAALGAIDRPAWLRAAIAALLALASPRATLHYLPEETLGRAASIAWTAGLGAGAFAVGLSTDRLAARREGIVLPIALWVVASGGAAAVAVFSFVSAGQVAGTVAAGLGALAFFSWWRPLEGRVRAAVPVVVTVLAAVLVDAVFMAGFPRSAALLLAGAPLAAWAGEVPALASRPLVAGIASIAAAAIPTGVAVLLSVPPPESY